MSSEDYDSDDSEASGSCEVVENRVPSRSSSSFDSRSADISTSSKFSSSSSSSNTRNLRSDPEMSTSSHSSSRSFSRSIGSSSSSSSSTSQKKGSRKFTSFLGCQVETVMHVDLKNKRCTTSNLITPFGSRSSNHSVPDQYFSSTHIIYPLILLYIIYRRHKSLVLLLSIQDLRGGGRRMNCTSVFLTTLIW